MTLGIQENCYKTKVPTQKKMNYTTYILLSLLMLPIVYIAFYNYPCADDFNTSITTKEVIRQGGTLFQVIIEAIRYTLNGMLTWSGRYTYTFLATVQPGIFGEKYYGLTAIFSLSIIFIGIIYTVKNLISNVGGYNNKYCITILSLLIFFTLIETMPSPVEGIFWYNGVVAYMVPWTLSLICIVKYLKGILNLEKIGLNIVITSILSFLLSGASDIFPFVNILVMILLFILNKRKRIVQIVPMVLGTLGIMINIFSPGTQTRMQAVGERAGMLKTIVAVTIRFFSCLNMWCNIAVILLLFMITPILYRVVLSIIENRKFQFQFPLICTLCSTMVICMMLSIPYYILGNFGAGRVSDVIYFTLVMVIIVNYAYWMGWFLYRNLQINIINVLQNIFINMKPSKKVVIGMYIAIILFIGVYGNGKSTTFLAIRSIMTGEAKQYKIEMEERLQVYEDETEKNIVVQELSVKPELLFFDDITEDENDWRNVSLARYYNKETVKSEK